MYFSKGRVTRQAHVDIPEGTVEEEYAREGFAGRVSHLYRAHPPVDWVHIEGPLKPRALHTGKLPGLSDDWITGRVPFLQNGDVVLAWAELRSEMPYYFRNADGDEVLFVHQGQGKLETDFGTLDYARGDYLVIPRGTVYRLSPTKVTKVLLIVTREQVRLPDRGIAGKHALFDPAVMDTPELTPVPEPDKHWQLKVQRLGQTTTITYPHNPITTVGWKGDLTVWRINVRDIRHMMSERYHLPPTAHVTFMTDTVVICSFLPRGLETGDPGALTVPFYHSNVDFDEVLFYHDGDFFSREGVDAGMVTFHPQGIHHGPQPGAVHAAKGKRQTNEQAVMVDTRNPLHLSEQAGTAEQADYWKSWMNPSNKEKA